jgi:molybdenum-dependent DNA-binding transcriptional regulator ModE
VLVRIVREFRDWDTVTALAWCTFWRNWRFCVEKASTIAARPSKLTEENAEEIYACLRQGMSISMAADAIGVSYGTIRGWIEKGENGVERTDNGSPEYVEFVAGVRRSMGHLGSRLVQTVNDMMAPGVENGTRLSAAKFLLQHRFKADFGSSTQNTAMTVNVGQVAPDPRVTLLDAQTVGALVAGILGAMQASPGPDVIDAQPVASDAMQASPGPDVIDAQPVASDGPTARLSAKPDPR